MSRRRRLVVLAGLALLLGGLAATEIQRREQQVQSQIGPSVPVVIARQDIPAGTSFTKSNLTIRQVPARYAPVEHFSHLEELLGLSTDQAIQRGTDISTGQLAAATKEETPGLPRSGRRVLTVTARVPAELSPGVHVDVVMTQEGSASRAGRAELLLEDVAVVAVGMSGADESEAGDDRTGSESQNSAQGLVLPTALVSLDVSLRQALSLAAAQDFAREIQLLVRPRGEARHGQVGLQAQIGGA